MKTKVAKLKKRKWGIKQSKSAGLAGKLNLSKKGGKQNPQAGDLIPPFSPF